MNTAVRTLIIRQNRRGVLAHQAAHTMGTLQSVPDTERPWSMPEAATGEPVGTVTCARQIGSLPPGPSAGFIQKRAPLSEEMPASAVHASSPRPIVEMPVPALPSVGPTVSYESNSALALTA